MSKTFSIDPFELREHEKASELIPEMSEEVWISFFDNVKEFGIRQPLDINQNNEVLDGRHRLRAAKELNLESIEVRKHELTEDEQLEFVRDTAIEVKELSPAEKHKIFTNAEVLIKDIYEKGKKNRTGRPPLNNKSGSLDPHLKKHNTSEEVAKVIGTGSATVKRLNKVKKENPDLYEEVVKGNKTPTGAYYELPTVKQPKGKRVGSDVVKQVKKESPKKRNDKRLFDFQPSNVTKEEEVELLLQSKNETIKSYLRQIKMLLNGTENLEEIITLNSEDDLFYEEHLESINKLSKALNKKHGGVKQ